MAFYVNFYETLAEATMRLKDTVVLYDGEPYMVLHISDHFQDGIFRIYMEPFGDPSYVSLLSASSSNETNPFYTVPKTSPQFGPALDAVVANQTDKSQTRLIRKMMNSPLFRKFRPFPLGMVKLSSDKLVYTERSPTRRVEQGLIPRMIRATAFNVACLNGAQVSNFGWQTKSFRDTIMGLYPPAQEAFTVVCSESHFVAPYSRFDAFFKNLDKEIFLAHKNNRVGFLPKKDLSLLSLYQEYRYLIEYYQESGIYGSVTVS